MKERRRSVRVMFFAEVVLEINSGKTYYAKVVNLNMGGVSFLMEEPLLIRSVGKVRFKLPYQQKNKEITIPFKVIHATKGASLNSARVGVVFTYLSYENAMVLYDYLQAQHLLNV
ncbi:MAG: PilZ domain-containing protein [Candidatus Theseobacter exili]|nr:PilZ domain-containing protein [Candidatus Theseobacter exili]